MKPENFTIKGKKKYGFEKKLKIPMQFLNKNE